LNSFSNEDLLVNNSTLQTLVPSLQIGSPLSVLANGTIGDDEGITVSSYSKIAYFWNNSADIKKEDLFQIILYLVVSVMLPSTLLSQLDTQVNN